MSDEGAAGDSWSLYVLRRADGALYTGITTDVARRVDQHDAGRGAKSLRGRGPLRLELARELGARGLATRVEQRVKRLPKRDKEELLDRPALLDALVADVLAARPTPPRPSAAPRPPPDRPSRPTTSGGGSHAP